MNMPFQFLLGNTPIKQAEAAALEGIGGSFRQGLAADKIFKTRRHDRTMLFEMGKIYVAQPVGEGGGGDVCSEQSYFHRFPFAQVYSLIRSSCSSSWGLI